MDYDPVTGFAHDLVPGPPNFPLPYDDARSAQR